MLKKNWLLRVTLPLMLSALVSACSTPLPPSSGNLPVVKPAAFPQLPLSVQTTSEANPAFCLPNCSAALTRERESWQRMLTGPE
ncbi:Uncharacterised protein [Serratia entomophila]|nr:Uncharacterised protein [Serratia quinivorans]CAI1986664.1 Uncharacterised protein [Serratia entomophila]CAI2037244.1 Uncharacterised protein [Serratia proteamaculans]